MLLPTSGEAIRLNRCGRKPLPKIDKVFTTADFYCNGFTDRSPIKGLPF
jgi:hypothetical protein